jgi:competence protein ComEC
MILSIIFGFIAGIWIGSITPATMSVIGAFFILAIILWVYKIVVKPEQQKVIACIIFLLCGIGCGLSRVYLSNLYEPSKLEQFVNQKIKTEGIIVAEPDVREDSTKLTIKLSTIFIASSTVPVSEKILVTVPLYPEYHYGDKVSLFIKLEEPKQIESDDGRVFNYKNYLRVRGVWYTSRFGSIHLLSSGHGSLIKNTLFSVKGAFTTALNRVIPQPESSLMAGLLLGTKQSLGKDLLGEFSRAGVSHVVVLSGYNIAIVAESIIALFSFLPATFAFVFGCIGIILFTMLAGGGASAWRAAIMVLVALWARQTGREYQVGRALGFAIIIMLAHNPLLLVFDPSFQLSILATIGIVFISPILAPYFTNITEKYGLREIVSSTIATQVTVLPYLIYSTGVLSFVSLPVNVLILGTIPTTMFFGFLTGVVGLVSMYLSFIPALFSYVLLWYQLQIVDIGATLPYGAISLPAFSWIFVVFIYVTLTFGFVVLHKRKS